MLLKIDVTANQLKHLQTAIAAEENHYPFGDSLRPYISIHDIKTLERERSAENPGQPKYAVTLEAIEQLLYGLNDEGEKRMYARRDGLRTQNLLVPFDKLQRVLQAMDLFPVEERRPLIDVDIF